MKENFFCVCALNGTDVFVAGDKLYKITSYRSKLWFSTSIISNALTCNYVITFILFYNMELS